MPDRLLCSCTMVGCKKSVAIERALAMVMAKVLTYEKSISSYSNLNGRMKDIGLCWFNLIVRMLCRSVKSPMRHLWRGNEIVRAK